MIFCVYAGLWSLVYIWHLLCYAKLLQHVWLCNPTDYSPPGSSVHGILQARILEWIAIPFSRASSWPRDRTWVSCVSCTAGVLCLLQCTSTLPTKIHLVKARVFPVVMYECESWTIKKAEHQRIDAFELWCWRRHLRVPWTARRSNQSSSKGNQSWIFIGRTDAEAEAPILWPPDVKSWLTGKQPDAGKDWRREEKGTTEDEMFGWHHRLNGHEFEEGLGDGEGQGSPSCCSPQGRKDRTWLSERQQQQQLLTLHLTLKKIWSLLVEVVLCRVQLVSYDDVETMSSRVSEAKW